MRGLRWGNKRRLCFSHCKHPVCATGVPLRTFYARFPCQKKKRGHLMPKGASSLTLGSGRHGSCSWLPAPLARAFGQAKLPHWLTARASP